MTNRTASYAGYLTEQKLGSVLNKLFSNVYRQCKLSGSKLKFDYYLPAIRLAVEFDGYSHYTSHRVIERDQRKAQWCRDNQVLLVRIPYFVQLTESTFKALFGFSAVVKSDYKQGFVDSKALLPYDFSVFGLRKFHDDISRLPVSCRRQILKTCPNLDTWVPT